MNRHLHLISWLVIAVLVIAATIVLILQTKAEDSLPGSTVRLDQLNIQTRDPQPAGKNITR